MSRFRIVFLFVVVMFVTAVLPFFLVIIPNYQKHIFLKKQVMLLVNMRAMLEQVPDVIKKNKRQLDFFEKKLHQTSTLQTLEKIVNKNKLFVESMRPYQGIRRDEIHLVITGKYENLLHFISNLSRQPNAIDIIYLSIEKDKIEMVLKDDGGV